MFTMTQALEEALLQHFMYRKLEISYAIRKPFPFFEGLRDKSFITERTYRESLEACRNLVPVSRVVYNILTKLEDSFSLSFLKMLFSQINLREYPDLMTIFKSFRSVVTSCGGWNEATLTPLEAPANPRERSSCQTLLSLPPPQHPPPRHLTPTPRVSAPGAASLHIAEVLDEPSGPTGPAQALLTVTQKKRITPVTDLTTHINDEEDLQQMPSTPSITLQMVRNDSPEPNDAKELQEASSATPKKKGKKRKRYSWSTPRNRHKKKKVPRGTTSPGHGIQEKLQEVTMTERKNNSTGNAEVVTRDQKARDECDQTSELEEVSDDASETNEGKRYQEPPSTPPRIMRDSLDRGSKVSVEKPSGEKQKKRKKISQSSSKRRQKKSLPEGTTSPEHRIQEKLQVADQATQRKDNSTTSSKMMTRAQKAKIEHAQTSGLEEKNKDETVDFHSPKLPVTCGEAKGILYKEKMKQGTSVKCIKSEEGVWLTPREFEIKGKKAYLRNWKQSVYCGGRTLAQLIKEGLLFCPPRISLKREQTSLCEVCRRHGPLLCCNTCPRAFHKDCHIPSAEPERSPWSCTFCRMEASSRTQLCPRKSDVLARRMSPEEQLKCEFLLLKAYCHPRSFLFAEIPHNMKDYAEPFREAMWLDLIKERLAEKEYTTAWFVRDMRLIFLNHKNFFQASNLSQVGLDLEASFEKDLNELLISHEANEKSFQSLP